MAPSTPASYPSNWSLSLCSSSDHSSEVALSPDQLLLYLVAIVQGLQIDFLPLVSQKALDLVGAGATARIRQLPVNINVTVAFKTLRWSPETEVENLRHLTNEVMVLGSRFFRNHPNIIHLEGMCWEPGQEGDVHPALVFEKTHLGDLWDFMMSDRGIALPLKARLDICASICRTLQDLHRGRS